MIQINLLPWREKARKKKQARFAVTAGIFAGFGLLVTVFFHADYAEKISKQQQRNDILQATLDKESATLADLNKQKKDLIDIDDQLHFIYGLRQSGYRAVKLLNELATTSPDAITLFKIARNGNTIMVFGRAKSNMQITLFMENIEKTKAFSQPVLTEISGKESDTGEQRDFQLKLEQVE